MSIYKDISSTFWQQTLSFLGWVSHRDLFALSPPPTVFSLVVVDIPFSFERIYLFISHLNSSHHVVCSHMNRSSPPPSPAAGMV